MNFDNKIAVITGGASGIGLGVAKCCVKRKIKVVLADIEQGALNEAKELLEELGGCIRTVITDVSRPDQVERLAEVVFQEYGTVDLLFLNAGVNIRVPLWEHTINDWDWLIGVNVMGVIHGIKYFVPKMIENKSECYLITNASIMGLMKGTDAYSVSKHAIVALTEALHGQLKTKSNILKVSVLCPSFVRSKILYADRNRPDEFKNEVEEKSPEILANLEAMRKMNEGGKNPEEVGEILFDGLKKGIFYILTDKSSRFKNAVQKRMKEILKCFND